MAVQDPSTAAGFPCQHCGMVLSDMSSLLEHVDTHLQQEDERKFKCDECGRCYRHAGSLANHKKTHEVGLFECDICGKENSNALALKSHLRIHTSQKKYSCSECGKAFRLATQLATHERVHLTRRGKQPSLRKVDLDASAVDDRHEMEEHPQFESMDHLGISTGYSPSDDKTEGVYNTQSEASDDDANRPFKCDSCDKSYRHYRSLTNHKKTHQVGKFECNVCFKLFNNMAALYSHQRTHRGKNGADLGSQNEPNPLPPLDHFSSDNQDAAVNFCHLCQILYTTDEEFQEHIQMHNCSSLTFEPEDTLLENHNESYPSSIPSPQSNFYLSPTHNIPSVSSVDQHGNYEHPQLKIGGNGHTYSDYFNNQTSSSNSSQGEPQNMDGHAPSPPSDPRQSTENAPEMDETSATDSGDRPFKCQTCGKSYRHSGSLINHKRSHQVGIYQCSICRKSYPHLAALKSHLRLHKSQPSSFGLDAEGDWLSSEPLTVETQQGNFSPRQDLSRVVGEEAALGEDEEKKLGHNNGSLYPQQFNQGFSQDMTLDLPHNEHLMQRHMCADCGGTFADIAGIKSHSCPLLQQQHGATAGDYDNSLNYEAGSSYCAGGNAERDAEPYGLNGNHQQIYFQENFHDGASGSRPSGGAGDDVVNEEDDDGDLYQCSICGNSYTSMRALRSHLRGHTHTHGTPSSSGPSSMSSHEEAKDDEAAEITICSTCGESFANRQDMNTHQLLHESDGADNVKSLLADIEAPQTKEEAESIICGSCGIFCTSSHHLQNHGCPGSEGPPRGEGDAKADAAENGDPARVGAEGRHYRCDQCGRSYRHPGSLLNHKKSHKTGVFRCLVCQKRFYNLLALKNHQRSHFDIKRHTCHECGKAFKIQKQLVTHLRRHKENQAKIQELNNQIQALMQMNGTRPHGGVQPVTSDASQDSTSRRRRPQRPQQKTREIKEETLVKLEDPGDQRPFACDQCGRTYRHAGSLVNHKNSHKTGEYYCSVCNNTYSNQLAMKNHMRTHFAYKRHLCQNCGKRFRGKKQLLSHICGNLRKDRAGGRRLLKSRSFKCKECRRVFLSGDQLADHLCDGPPAGQDAAVGESPSKEERPFTCNICNRSYRHAGSLLNHKNTHKTGHFICTFCSKPFTNPMALRNHTRIHTQKKKFVCLTCGKAFRLASILHNHQKVHNRAASHLSCADCGKSFLGRSGLKRHRCRREQENGAQPGVLQPERGDKCFMCDLCGRSYRHAGSLLNHKKTHSENLHHCTLCLQTFPDALTLQIHSQMRRQCCPECGKTFCLLSHLQSHMEVHARDRAAAAGSQEQRHAAGEEPSHGGLCWDSEVAPSAGGTRAHVPPPLSHAPRDTGDSPKTDDASSAEQKSHVCEHCGRTYRHAGSLLNHKNSHKTGSFFCAVCQKEFTNLMALKNHRRIHTEPKRYQCQECGKAFRVSTQLICHRRIHTKEKPFVCLLCDKSFSSKSNLRHHQRMHQNSQGFDSSSFNMDASAFMDLDMGSFL